MQDIISQFIDAMRAAGCAPHSGNEIVADDKPHRYKLHNDKGSKKTGSYQLAIDGDFGYGWFLNFREGVTHKFSSKNSRPMSAQERKEFEIRLAEKKAAAEAEILAAQQAAAVEARELWGKGHNASEHPYLAKKKVSAHGVRVFEGDLIIPIYINNKIVNIQKITETGDKYFLPRAELKGGYFPIAEKDDDKSIIYICEGHATGDAVRKATVAPVIVAFNAGNLLPVAVSMRDKYPTARIVIAADNDQWTVINGKPYNTGLIKAKEAALRVGGFVVFPDFPQDDEKKRTDFNDLFCDFGIETVKEKLSFTQKVVSTGENEYDSYRDLQHDLDNFERDYEPDFESISEDPKIKKSDWPFKCLGYDRGKYFFLPKDSNQIVELTPPKFNENYLRTLADFSFWVKSPFAVWNDDGSLKKINWNMAAQEMINRCHAAGVFNPDNRQRGAGMWMESGHAVVHCGDSLIYRDKIYTSYEFESHWIYEAAVKRFSVSDERLSNEEGRILYDIITRPSWVSSTAGKLLCGWIVSAIACGCLKWRPHIWIMGEHGAGKSYVINEILNPILEGVAQFHGAGSTEAGIRQSLGHDALPVVMDETEGESMKDNEILQSILMMARRSSSGQSMTKGSATGQAQVFTLKSSFCFSSINHNIAQSADESRISIFEIKRDTRPDALERFEALDELVKKTLTAEFKKRLIRRIIEDLPNFLKNIETIFKEARKKSGESRVAQQISPLVAGVYSLVNGGIIPTEKVQDWITDDMLKFTNKGAKKDHEKLLEFLMSSTIRVTGNLKTHETQIGKAIATGLGFIESDYTKREAQTALENIDIKVRDYYVWIKKNSQHIKNKLRSTPWVNSWDKVLCMNEGIFEPEKKRRIGITVTHAIEIDPEIFNEDHIKEESYEIPFE